MSDPTADDFIRAMGILKQYTLDTQISIEGDCLIACVVNDMEVLDDDRAALEKLGWNLRVRDGKHSHFSKTFEDH